MGTRLGLCADVEVCSAEEGGKCVKENSEESWIALNVVHRTKDPRIRGMLVGTYS